MTGGCACGAIRYEIDGPPGFSFHCQCRQCQRASGGGHASAFVVEASALRLTGKPKFHNHTVANGNVVSKGFCETCGSPVLNRNVNYPDNRYIHAATLDDPALFRPAAIIFADEAQPWDKIGLPDDK